MHNGSSLFTGDAGQGESNIRRWIIENDWLEAIVALPLNMFYNTGIATYIWVLSNRKAAAPARQSAVDRRDAMVRAAAEEPGRQELRRCRAEDVRRICDVFEASEETEESKIFPNEAFGYWKVTVERPLRLEGIDPERVVQGQGDQGSEGGARSVGDGASRDQAGASETRGARSVARAVCGDRQRQAGGRGARG